MDLLIEGGCEMVKSFNDPIESPINRHNPPEGVYATGFKLHYTDGTVYAGTGDLLNAWDQATTTGLQVLVIYESSVDGMGRPTRHMVHGVDYYGYDGDTFYGCNDTRGVKGKVLYGEWTTDEEFEKIRIKAFNDYDI